MEEQQISIEEQIQKYLAEHLKVYVAVEDGDYGSSKFIKVKVVLAGEVISSSTDTF